MQDMKQIVSAKKEREAQEVRAATQRKMAALDATEVVRTASGRRFVKRLIAASPTALTAVTEPYKDAFVLGRISYRADLQSIFTKEQLRQIEDESLG